MRPATQATACETTDPVEQGNSHAMTLAIMQPYLLPYVGYFQLMKKAGAMVIYDDIKYSKGGWINRNRILSGGAPSWFTVPLKRGSDALDIRDRELSPTWPQERDHLLNRIRSLYRTAPYFDPTVSIIEDCLSYPEPDLFGFLKHSLTEMKRVLAIATPLIVSSTLGIDRSLHCADRVLATCARMEADHYINPIGGVGLYNPEQFLRTGIQLSFLRSAALPYPQLGRPFVPDLSILDVLMFNSKEQVQSILDTQYVLVTPGTSGTMVQV